MPTTIRTIDDVQAYKNELVDRYQILFVRYREAKVRHRLAENAYKDRESEIMATLDKVRRFELENKVLEQIEDEVKAELRDAEIELMKVKAELELCHSLSKELSDLIVIHGIKSKSERMLDRRR